MDETPSYEYIGVFDDGFQPDPEPMRLIRTHVVDGRVVEEIWRHPGTWTRTNFLVDLGFGHGEGEPRPVSREDMERWQQEFVEGWRLRDQGRTPS